MKETPSSHPAVRYRRVQSQFDLRLQSSLFVDADEQVRQMEPLRSYSGVLFEKGLVEAAEGRLEMVLTFRWLSWKKRASKVVQGALVEGGGGGKGFQEASHLAADLGKDLQVSTGDSFAGLLEGFLRPEHAQNQLTALVRIPLADLKEKPNDATDGCRAFFVGPQSALEGTSHVFLADGLASLLGGPDREGAPICPSGQAMS